MCVSLCKASESFCICWVAAEKTAQNFGWCIENGIRAYAYNTGLCMSNVFCWLAQLLPMSMLWGAIDNNLAIGISGISVARTLLPLCLETNPK